MAKLIDILARELKAWPETADWAVSVLTSGAPFVTFGSGEHPDQDQEDRHTHTWDTGNGTGRWEIFSRRSISVLPCDRLTSIITRAEWQAAVDALNAPKVVEWDDFGFPPAGVTCEFTTNDGHNWKGCKILYADEVSILTGELEGKADRRLLRKCDADVKFRPIRTAEKVAAEEREKAIKEICIDAGSPEMTPGQLKVAEKLYMAGYRKQ